MADSKIEIGIPGIKKALQRYTSRNAIAEFIWNGFDAGATKVDICYKANPLGRFH